MYSGRRYRQEPQHAPKRRVQPDPEGQKRQTQIPKPTKIPGLVPGFCVVQTSAYSGPDWPLHKGLQSDDKRHNCKKHAHDTKQKNRHETGRVIAYKQNKNKFDRDNVGNWGSSTRKSVAFGRNLRHLNARAHSPVRLIFSRAKIWLCTVIHEQHHVHIWASWNNGSNRRCVQCEPMNITREETGRRSWILPKGNNWPF